MNSIKRKYCLVFGLITLLSLGGTSGNVIPLFITAAAAQPAEEVVAPATTQMVEKVITPATTQAVEAVVESPPTNVPAVKETVPQQGYLAKQPLARKPAADSVRVGSSQKLELLDTVRDLITILGSSDAAGVVEHDMVTVFGGAKMNGKVGHDMVSVFGGAKMNGKVDHDMVTVFGNGEVNGPVGRDLVVVFGSLKLGSNAVVNHDCTVVFGKIDRHPNASLAKPPVVVLPWFSCLGDYIRSGPLLGRPLPPSSGLAWIVVSFYFLLYLLVAVILPKPTAGCVRQLDNRPLLSFGVGILTLILLAPLYFILAVTGVGIVLIPFIGLAETAFVVLGKTSALEFFGLQIRRRFSPDADDRPIIAFLVGFVLVTLLYMVPILGGLVWLALRPLALGAAVLSVFGKKNGNGGLPAAPGVPVQAVTPPVATTTSPVPPMAAFAAVGGTTQPLPATEFTAPSGAVTGTGTTLMPRTGFWIRLAATALDFILLVWLIPFVQVFFPFCWLAYHVAMWTWKGTTVGGIVCHLKLVRLDGRPVDFAVALVRGLASVFSALALCLGFFWVGWTPERQSWHDLIAGTVIVRVPRAVSLI